jgi:hypothetical protein
MEDRPRIVQFVKFRSSLSDADVRRVMQERAPRLRALPGLVQKYYDYGREASTGEYTGIYVWDSEPSARRSEGASDVYRRSSAGEARGTRRLAHR